MQKSQVRGDQTVMGRSRKTQPMVPGDKHVLPKSLPSFKQKRRVRQTRTVPLDHVDREEQVRSRLSLDPGF